MDDVVLLSRLQFALTIMFHYLFPPLAIGMGVVLVYLEGMFLKTGEPVYEKAVKFWTKIFALNFAVGVASGIVMEFEFGTNWAVYSRFVGDVFGSALAAEGIFAFFLESGFLALLVFGWDKVSPGMHFFSTIMVALGSIFSSIWIVVANSWQQTPAGHKVVEMMRDGNPWVVDGEPVLRAEIQDFWSLVFNPSTIDRLVHVWIGAFILGAFFIMSISAFYMLKRRHLEFAKRSFTGALILATVSSVAILFSGHHQAVNVYEFQPAKLAAFEGHYKSGVGDLSLMGIPDDEAETVHFDLAIPGGLSFLLHNDFSALVEGLDKFRPEDRPPVLIPFVSYHVIVGLGMLFIGLTLFAAFLRMRNKLFQKRWLMWIFVFAVIGPFLANELGWVAAEVGRQPWIVNPPVEWDAAGRLVVNDSGVVLFDEGEGLRTADAISEVVESEQVLGSIIMFGLIYIVLFGLWLLILDHKIRKGPEPVEGDSSSRGDPHDTGGKGLLDAASTRG
ncbi:MAG: cytochrome ubiquinol oxidase subunit I [Planctomycetes bacterium]|nr:cytochrome ubiquinol oxidase subunit I [Planctomycetota bacterium]